MIDKTTADFWVLLGVKIILPPLYVDLMRSIQTTIIIVLFLNLQIILNTVT
jgi:hypothetical protein